jgi:hypothetical protein
MGATVFTAATDENEQHSVGMSTTVGGVAITARSEQDDCEITGGGTGAEKRVRSVLHNGCLTVAFSRDTGQNGLYGDEAETL